MRSIAIVLLSTIGLTVPPAAQQAGSAASNRRPVLRGTFTDESLGQGVFSGTVSLERFAQDRADVVVVGRLLGALAASNGDVLGRVDQEVTLPVASVSATCQLLRLELGPVGVPIREGQLHLDKAVLGITARDGASNGQLGERLCSAANTIGRSVRSAAVAVVLNEVLNSIDNVR